jgi:prevent-host-death family protein
MEHMKTVGIRALKQNASAVVADAAAGEVVIITDRGRPVAQLIPVPATHLERLRAAGLTRPRRRSPADLPEPSPLQPGERSLTDTLRDMRDEERF